MMAEPGAPGGESRGPISYMARNGVAANLLMVFILIAGLFALRGLVQEVFPEISMDRVLVSVAYPGATPDEVEESIILKIEEQIEGVRRPEADSFDGRGGACIGRGRTQSGRGHGPSSGRYQGPDRPDPDLPRRH